MFFIVVEKISFVLMPTLFALLNKINSLFLITDYRNLYNVTSIIKIKKIITLTT